MWEAITPHIYTHPTLPPSPTLAELEYVFLAVNDLDGPLVRQAGNVARVEPAVTLKHLVRLLLKGGQAGQAAHGEGRGGVSHHKGAA